MEVTVSQNDAGGVVAINRATLKNVSSDASVSASATSELSLSVGGIAGQNTGIITLSNSASFVSGHNDIGGLVGINRNDGIIKLSSATNSISGSQDVGGLVGTNAGEIRHTWAGGGDVAAGKQVGGLVGNNNGEIMSSYAYGDDDGRSSVSGNSNVGGFVGANSGSISASYWDTQTTGQSSSAGSARGLTTDEMTGSAAQTSMSGLDFDTVWNTRSGGYPILARQVDDKSDQSDSTRVQLSNVNLTPQAVNPNSESTHRLTFEAQNVSADGSEDKLNITFPNKVELVSYSNVEIDERSSESIK
jgi:hypothetical protein